MDSEVRLTCKCLVKIAAVQNSNHYTIQFYCSVISLERIVIFISFVSVTCNKRNYHCEAKDSSWKSSLKLQFLFILENKSFVFIGVSFELVSFQRTACRRGVADSKFDNTRVKTKTKPTINTGYRSRMRQKPVCHTRPRVKCNSCKQRVDWTGRRDKGPEGRIDQDDTLYLPYCNKCGLVLLMCTC